MAQPCWRIGGAGLLCAVVSVSHTRSACGSVPWCVVTRNRAMVARAFTYRADGFNRASPSCAMPPRRSATGGGCGGRCVRCLGVSGGVWCCRVFREMPDEVGFQVSAVLRAGQAIPRLV